jgi:sigma-B regulation protein RsbU (phosphoserine phosphatase)
MKGRSRVRSAAGRDLAERLATSPLFQGVPLDELGDVLARCPLQRFHKGELALAPGDANRFLHVVLSGRFHVQLEPGASRAITAMAPGDCFGEMSILDGAAVSAFVVADGEGEVLSVPEQIVWSDLLAVPGVARNLMRVLTSRLRHSIRTQHAYDEMRKELHLARQIQASMLPRGTPLFPDHAELDGCAVMDPAAEVGGDFFDAFFTDDHRAFVCVGDVAGKGMAAALFMARSVTLLRLQALRRAAPREVLSRVNEALAAGNESGTFVAAFCAVLDVKNGELRYAHGGLGQPLLRRSGRWQTLPLPRGLVVGVIEGFDYEAARIRLEPNDAVLIFSDGVTEAMNEHGELFSNDRLVAFLETTGDVPASELVDAVRAEVRAFAGAAPASDDLTLMAVRFTGQPTVTRTGD